MVQRMRRAVSPAEPSDLTSACIRKVRLERCEARRARKALRHRLPKPPGRCRAKPIGAGIAAHSPAPAGMLGFGRRGRPAARLSQDLLRARPARSVFVALAATKREFAPVSARQPGVSERAWG